MPGCRKLSDTEILLMIDTLETPRDKCLFILGLLTGFRVSELLSLNVSDVIDHTGNVKERLTVRRRDMKGKLKGRTTIVHPRSKVFILDAIQGLPIDGPLFPSRKGGPLTRFGAHGILKSAYERLNFQGKVATHSMRKTFANKVFENLNRDIYKTMRALGHDRSENTVRYLEIDQPEIDSAIISIEVKND